MVQPAGPAKLPQAGASGAGASAARREPAAAIDAAVLPSCAPPQPADPPCHHATYDDAVANVDWLVAAGAKPGKILLGIPAYGRKVTVPSEVKTYNDILRHVGPLPLPSDDAADERKGPGSKQRHWSFNGVGTAVRKADMVR